MQSNSETAFSLLMERVQSGCPRAAQDVVNRYGSYLRKVVRRRLHQRMRPRYDSLDFLQDVWVSFFRTTQTCTNFESPGELIAFLAKIACKKVTDEYRHLLLTEKRNLNREHSLTPPKENDRGHEPPVRQPTPSQVAVANERWEQMLHGLPPEYRRMLELLRQGFTHEEIAQSLGTYTKVIQRLLVKLERKEDSL